MQALVENPVGQAGAVLAAYLVGATALMFANELFGWFKAKPLGRGSPRFGEESSRLP